MKKAILSLVRSIFFAVSIISIVVIGVLNSTWIYGQVVNKYNLLQYTNLSYERLIENYKILIDYLSNPFTNELVFMDFPMSTNGRIHFEEVKNIFISLELIILIFIIFIIVIVIINKNNKKSAYKIILKGLNGAANLIVTLVLLVFVAVSINFSKTFEVFHKIFFRNDYWVFDTVTDPIINVLPEEFFFIELIIILSILAIIIIGVKVLKKKAER